MFALTVRRHRTPRPDDSMQDHRDPPDVLAWTTYVGALMAVLASVILVGSGLHSGLGVWVLLLFGAAVIDALLSLAVLPSLRKR